MKNNYLSSIVFYPKYITTPTCVKITKETNKCYFTNTNRRILKTEVEYGKILYDSFSVYGIGETEEESISDVKSKTEKYIMEMLNKLERKDYVCIT